MVDHNQEHSTKQLRERTHDVYKWKTTLERAIKANMDEISALAEQRDRLMVALSVLNLPESIGTCNASVLWFVCMWPECISDIAATECIERRCRRPDSELIRDAPDEELIEEVALISEIRKVLNGMLKEVNAQQERNRAARQRLEADWSDKKHAYGIESINSSLSNKSTVALFRPGATRYLDELSIFYPIFTSSCWFLFFSNSHLMQAIDGRTLGALHQRGPGRMWREQTKIGKNHIEFPKYQGVIIKIVPCSRSNCVQPSMRCYWMRLVISEPKPITWSVHLINASLRQTMIASNLKWNWRR